MCGNFKRLYCLLVSMSHYSKSLINAAESGDLKKTEYYLTKTNPVPVDSTDDENQTALHYACANGHKDIVRLLIKHGASLECVNWTGWTPLMYASYYGHKDVVAILIDIKANINARNNRFSTPLTCAARCGYTDVVELLLKSGAGCDPIFKIDKGDKNGHRAFVTPLMASAQHGHFRIVDLLLQYEADVNYQNPDTNCTALMLAAANGHFDIVELLINKGNANPNLKNSRGDNALLMSKEHEEVYKFLKIRTEKQKKERPTMKESYQSLFEAVRGNSEELAKLLNTQGINVNEKDVNGATPLIYACIHKKVQNVRLLLSKGADPNIQEQLQGWTALMQATIRKCVDIVKILLDHNANILIKNSKGLTVFDLATYVGEPQITRLLCPKLIDEQRSNSNNEKNKQGVKTMISRVGEKFGIKSSQANQTLNRVSPYDLYNGPSIMGTSHESDEPELRKTASVLSDEDGNDTDDASTEIRSDCEENDVAKLPVITSSGGVGGTANPSNTIPSLVNLSDDPLINKDAMFLEALQKVFEENETSVIFKPHLKKIKTAFYEARKGVKRRIKQTHGGTVVEQEDEYNIFDILQNM